MNTQVNDPKGAAGALKAPMHLIPPYALEQTAWVQKLGAEKYGKVVPVYTCNNGSELAEFCSCGYSTQNQRATQKDPTLHADYAFSATAKNTQEVNKPLAMKEELRGPKDYVNPAMTNSLDFQIQITINDKKVLLMTGSQKIKSILESNILDTIADRKLREGILSIIESELSQPLACLCRTNIEFWPTRITDVKFAADLLGEVGCSTLTTTTVQVNSEDSSATDATKVLACSETILNLLKKHSPTCKVRNLIVRNGEVEQYGAYNWRKTGVCATTYVSAIMRHLNAWRDGEDLDPESGISHIAHIATSCNILLDAGHCGTLQDDRNKKPVPNTFAAAVAEAEAVKDEPVALDQRDLPIPSGWNLPPIPEGYDRWVYRGTFKGHTIVTKDRHVLYDFEQEEGDWHKTIYFSGNFHHIEAVKDEPVAPDGLPPYPPVPEGYTRWVYRGKGWKTDRRVCFATAVALYDLAWVVFPFGCTVGYQHAHYIEAVKD